MRVLGPSLGFAGKFLIWRGLAPRGSSAWREAPPRIGANSCHRPVECDTSRRLRGEAASARRIVGGSGSLGHLARGIDDQEEGVVDRDGLTRFHL